MGIRFLDDDSSFPSYKIVLTINRAYFLRNKNARKQLKKILNERWKYLLAISYNLMLIESPLLMHAADGKKSKTSCAIVP